MTFDRFDDVLHELKGNPNAPPYCFFTKRLGSELVMKTLVGKNFNINVICKRIISLVLTTLLLLEFIMSFFLFQFTF